MENSWLFYVSIKFIKGNSGAPLAIRQPKLFELSKNTKQ